MKDKLELGMYVKTARGKIDWKEYYDDDSQENN